VPHLPLKAYSAALPTGELRALPGPLAVIKRSLIREGGDRSRVK